MFNINKTGSTYTDVDKTKITKVSWKDSMLFFRFGYFRYVKINAYQSISQYLEIKRESVDEGRYDIGLGEK